MDPQYIEKQAIIPLEGAISTLEGIDLIESSVDRQRSMIYIYYNQDVEIKYAYLKLQEKVNELKSILPDEFNVTVVKVDTERLSNTFMQLQIRGSGGLERIRTIVDEQITDELLSIDGIANVEAVGGNIKAVEIILEEDACRELNITPSKIRSLIAQNTEMKLFLGQAHENNRHYYVNLLAEYTDIRDLENIVIADGPIFLKDIAEVNFGEKEQTSISRVNGLEAISIQLIRDSMTNLIEVSHSTKEVIERLNNELKPLDIEIVIQGNSADTVEENINLIIKLALIGCVFAVFILWIFLKNMKLVAVVMFAIPISVFTAFNFFYAFGITINSFTLVGMALAIGLLLDNSVVVLENIFRLVSSHKDTDTAVIQGTSEVSRALFAATLTTITVFVPFIFSSDYLIRLIGRHIGVSIISTLIVSFVVAMLLIPMVTHFILERRKPGKEFYIHKVSQKNRLFQIYNLLLKSAIRFPARTIVGAVVVFFGSVLLCMALSLQVPREIDMKEFNLYVTMSRGSTLDISDTVVAELEEKLVDIEEIRDIVCNIYEEEASITIILKDDFEALDNRTIPEIKHDIQNRIEDFRAADVSLTEPQSSNRFGGGMSRNSTASLERMFGIGTPQEKIVVKGEDFNMLQTVAEDIKYRIDTLDSMNNEARLSIPRNRPEIHLFFDNRLLSLFNIPMSSIASELSSFQNEFTSGMSFKQGNDEYDIIIRNKDIEEEKTFDDLKELPVQDQSGSSYELDTLSRIIYSYGRSGVTRINQEKQIELTYSFKEEINGSKSLLALSREEIEQVVAGIAIPPGTAAEIVYDESELSEFYFLIIVAFILIYMILASVFESLSTPVVMMFTIPLAGIGAFWALIFTGNSLFNANSLIGFLILLGVVVNNGIILIDYTRILRRRGYTRSRALMMSGQARIRPILITAITTMAAMLPLAMGNTEQISRIGAPFAITVIGGLSLSTLFTLVFIPTVYSGMESAMEWMKQLNWKMKLLQLIIFIAGILLIYYHIESVLWQCANAFLLLMIIPGSTYFIMNSLRQAKTDYIRPDEKLTINIRRIVKIYDYYSRFVREWKKGERIEKLYGLSKDYRTWRDFDNYIFWQLPLLGFLIYYVYFYIQNTTWIFILSHIVYFYLFFLLAPVQIYLANRAEKSGKAVLLRVNTWLYNIILWGIPFVNILLFYWKEFRNAPLVFIAVFWYLSLIVYTTSNRLQKGKVNIMRLTGRFAGIRLQFYRFVKIIPIIGKKKNPFSALDGVSLNIQSGMFGLLGPNGAGKTTIMRIICGICNQSLGTISINDIDFREKREELQGLIGYLPQEFGTYENMTAYEFLDYLAILKNIYDKNERNKIVNFALSSVHLDEKKDHKIGSFSGGMKQRIGIALTLLHLPRILVVDEPTAGLDPRERIRFRNLLVELSSERIVIFSTHIIEDISSSCNTVAVLNRGKLYYLGTPIKMTQLAHEKVWQFAVTPEEFETIRHKLRIVHHMHYENKIRVRCLSETVPHEGAQNVRPTLEDSYLWLLGKKKDEVEVAT